MSVAPTAGTAPSSPAVHRPRRSWWRIDRHDVLWLIALTLVAGALRFGSPFFLDIFAHPGSAAPVSAWGIGHNYQDPSLPGLGKPNDIAPNSPFVFDELYFANDAHDDLLGRDYFDPEPPLAKLIIAIGIKLFGFNSFGWRFMPALFGTALIPLMYLLARQLLTVRFFAIAAGVLTAFDGLTFVASYVSADLGRCFQLMETDDVTLFQRWIADWQELVEFEVVPVVEGKTTRAALESLL